MYTIKVCNWVLKNLPVSIADGVMICSFQAKCIQVFLLCYFSGILCDEGCSFFYGCVLIPANWAPAYDAHLFLCKCTETMAESFLT